MNSLFNTIDGSVPRPSDTLPENPLVTLWKQRLLFTMVFMVVVVIAIAATYLLPPRYFTSGSLIVAEPESGLSLPPAGWAQKVGDPADIESQLLVIRSPRLMRLVLGKPGVMDTIHAECEASRNPVMALFSNFGCDDLKADSTSSIDYLTSRYTVNGAGRSRVITIGYTSRQPDIAQRMANELVTTFLEDHRQSISGARVVAMRSLTEEIDRLDEEIRSDDGKIQIFRGNKGLTNGATAPITSERLSSINTQLALAESSRSQAASIIAAAENGGTESAATVPAVLENRSVADVKQRLAAAIEQSAAAAIALGPRHPRLRAFQGQVEALQITLVREVGNVVDGARKQFDAAERTVASLKSEMDAAKVDAASASREETSIEQMVRDLGVKRTQYAMFFNQRKGLESEQKALLGSTRLVSFAEFPEQKFFPKKGPFLAGGFAMGIIVASAAALFRGRMSGPVDTSAPGSSRSHAPPGRGTFFAHMPFVGRREGPARGMPDTIAEATTNSEIQGVLATILAHLEGKARSVVILSAFKGEGKTFTTMALARFAAEAGKQVLVVEADTRNPVFVERFCISAEATLVDILCRRTAAYKAVVKTDLRGLDVITAGTTGRSPPPEWLMGEPLVEFLAWASAYDLVLIDGPALDGQMDAGLLACRADGFLFCVGGDKEQLAAMEAVGIRLTNLGARSLGFVLTPTTGAIDQMASGPDVDNQVNARSGGR